MNNAIGIGLGIVAIVIAIGVIAGGSTILNDGIINSIPNDEDNKMQIGDKISVSVQPSDSSVQVEPTEGKSLEINLVDCWTCNHCHRLRVEDCGVHSRGWFSHS